MLFKPGPSSSGETPRTMTKNTQLTDKRRAVLHALQKLPDDWINTTDIPEVIDWSGAQRGVYYRPVKQQITLRLDADFISWFKAHAQGGRGDQTDTNRALRGHVERCEKRGTA
jgi:uncharacterized protein (DUF4415 family)